ncbi:carbonic anhydrase [Mycobacterium paragordonae]|uniref:carbonic anhydrase n=1 Tax=Mycobacterium paragordonae TaxID=1389713 RepID=UPI001E4BE24B|nr:MULTISPECIES: carbonic anhydrase [Mycobacterium]
MVGRRRMLALGALGLGAAAAAVPRAAAAPDIPPQSYDAMLLMCIDPRFVNPTNEYMLGRGLVNRYSQFALAGAGAGAVSQHWEAWHNTFWDNLAASIELHSINGVIVVNHRDCGAVQIAYGPDAISTPERETATHERILGTFREEALRRHPGIDVETWLMALDGSVEQIGPRSL